MPPTTAPPTAPIPLPSGRTSTARVDSITPHCAHAACAAAAGTGRAAGSAALRGGASARARAAAAPAGWSATLAGAGRAAESCAPPMDEGIQPISAAIAAAQNSVTAIPAIQIRATGSVPVPKVCVFICMFLSRQAFLISGSREATGARKTQHQSLQRGVPSGGLASSQCDADHNTCFLLTDSVFTQTRPTQSRNQRRASSAVRAELPILYLPEPGPSVCSRT